MPVANRGNVSNAEAVDKICICIKQQISVIWTRSQCSSVMSYIRSIHTDSFVKYAQARSIYILKSHIQQYNSILGGQRAVSYWIYIAKNIARHISLSKPKQWLMNNILYYFLTLKWQRSSRSVMMTSSNGNIFRVTGPLWGEFTGQRWVPLTKANGAELWCFIWSAPKRMVEQTIETLVSLDTTMLIMTSL